MEIKNKGIFILFFSFLLLSACESNNVSSCSGEFPEVPSNFCPQGQVVQYTRDQNGCHTQYQCSAPLAFGDEEFNDCLQHCDDTSSEDITSLYYCKASCHTQKADYTKDKTNCEPILELARQAPNDLSSGMLASSMETLYDQCIDGVNN